MNDPQISRAGLHRGGNMNAKLRAALDYLGDKLTTHRASRFKPANQYLLDEWLATRRATKGSLMPADRTLIVKDVRSAAFARSANAQDLRRRLSMNSLS